MDCSSQKSGGCWRASVWSVLPLSHLIMNATASAGGHFSRPAPAHWWRLVGTNCSSVGVLSHFGSLDFLQCLESTACSARLPQSDLLCHPLGNSEWDLKYMTVMFPTLEYNGIAWGVAWEAEFCACMAHSLKELENIAVGEIWYALHQVAN